MSETKLHVGPAGWSYRDWEGRVFPRGREKPKDPLAYLAGYFDCIEINSTFYRIPPVETVADWAERTAGRGDFLFTVKLWKGFTHENEVGLPYEECEAFRAVLDELACAGRLGALLVQFPWFFRDSLENRRKLARIAAEFGDFPLVLEVRSRSWTEKAPLAEIAAMGFGFCNIDQPVAGDSVVPASIVTSRVGYARLHGRNSEAWFDRDAGRDDKYDYLYDEEELSEWVPLVQEIRERTTRTFVVTNNHYKGKAVVNALELRAALEKTRVAVPDPLLVAYPRLDRVSDTKKTLFGE